MEECKNISSERQTQIDELQEGKWVFKLSFLMSYISDFCIIVYNMTTFDCDKMNNVELKTKSVKMQEYSPWICQQIYKQEVGADFNFYQIVSLISLYLS